MKEIRVDAQREEGIIRSRDLGYNARPQLTGARATLSMASEPQSKQSPALSADDKKHMRTIGHSLKPVVMVAGAGLSEGVLAEIDRALHDHELIKVKMSVGDRELKKQLTQQLCEQSRATLIQTIGNIVLILRKAKKPNPQLSNLQRTKK